MLKHEHGWAKCPHVRVILCHLHPSLDFHTLLLGDLFCGGNKQPSGLHLLLSTFTFIPGGLLLLLTVSESTQQLKQLSEDLGPLVLLTWICVAPPPGQGRARLSPIPSLTLPYVWEQAWYDRSYSS